MRMASHLLCATACLLALGAARPTSRPAREAEGFLDRARSDIETMLGEAPAMGELSVVELTQMLANARGGADAQDQALAAQALARVEHVVAPVLKPEFRPIDVALARAMLARCAGRPDEAARALDEAERIAGTVEAIKLGRFDLFGDAIRGLRAELAGYDAIVRDVEGKGRVSASEVVVQYVELADGLMGPGELPDRLRRRAHTLATAADPPPSDDALRTLSHSLAAGGADDDALAVALRIADPQRRISAVRGVEYRASEFGRHRAAAMASAKAFELASAEGRPQPWELYAFARDAHRARDRATFAAVARAADGHWGERGIRTAAFARGHLDLMGDREAFNRIFRAAEKAAEALRGGEREEAMIDLAACHAAAGRHDEALKLVDELDRERLANSDAFDDLYDAYLRAGDFDRAVAVIDRHLDGKDRGLPYGNVARAAADAGRWDVALDVVSRQSDSMHRLRSLRLIAREQARAGAVAEIEPWLSKLPSARERALARIGVAMLLLNRPRDLWSRLYGDR